MGDGLREKLVRRDHVFLAVPERDGGVVTECSARGFSEQRRLAQTRLPGDEEDLSPAPAVDPEPRRGHGLEVGGSADESLGRTQRESFGQWDLRTRRDRERLPHHFDGVDRIREAF